MIGKQFLCIKNYFRYKIHTFQILSNSSTKLYNISNNSVVFDQDPTRIIIFISFYRHAFSGVQKFTTIILHHLNFHKFLNFKLRLISWFDWYLKVAICGIHFIIMYILSHFIKLPRSKFRPLLFPLRFILRIKCVHFNRIAGFETGQ